MRTELRVVLNYLAEARHSIEMARAGLVQANVPANYSDELDSAEQELDRAMTYIDRYARGQA